MPQIVIMAPRMDRAILVRLGRCLIPEVERCFGIEGEKDTAITVTNEVETEDEADVQIEIRYTAGQLEYGRTTPFDPTLKEQEALSEAITAAFYNFLERELHGADLSHSVWCKPWYNSHFKMWKRRLPST